MFRIASIPKKSTMLIKRGRFVPFTIQKRSTSFTLNTENVSKYDNYNWCVINSACRKIAEDEIKKQLTEFEKHFTEFKNVHNVEIQWLKKFGAFGWSVGMGLGCFLLKSNDDIKNHMDDLEQKMDKKIGDLDKKIGDLEQKMDKKFGDLDKKFDEMKALIIQSNKRGWFY